MPFRCRSWPITGPTISVLSTSNVPRFGLLQKADDRGRLLLERKSLLDFCRSGAGGSESGSRPGSPYRWTAFSPGIASSALRTASSVTGCSNWTTTSVPPEKSMPRGTPRVAISPRPLRMISHESAEGVPPPAQPVDVDVGQDTHGQMLSAAARRRVRTSSNIVRDTKIAVKTFAARPIASDVRKAPDRDRFRTGSRNAAAISDATWVSTIVHQTRSNPA